MGLFSDPKISFSVSMQYIVSGIPSEVAIPNREFVILGRVLGNMEISTRRGKIMLPHLHFVGMYGSTALLS